MQGCKNICLQGVPNKTRSLLTKSKGKEMSGGEARKTFISVRPTPGRQRTNVSKTVSKVPKILPGLYGKCGAKGGGVCVQVGSEGQIHQGRGDNDR